MDLEKVEQLKNYTPPEYKSSKFILIIDGNFFCTRMMYAGRLNFKQPHHANEFLNSCFDVLSQEIKTLKPFISKVFFVKDGRSWRKDITPIVPKEMPQLVGGCKYKENRVKDDSINWDVYGKSCDIFYERLKTLDVYTINAKSAEGDDSIAILSKVYTSNKLKTLIWTSDGDMSQLVNDYCAFYKVGRQQKRDLYLSKEMKQYYDLLPTGVMMSTLKPDNSIELLKLVESVEVINPHEFIFNKIVKGDTKDNVPPLFWKEKSGKAGVRKYAPTSAQINKFLKEQKITEITRHHLYDTEFIQKLVVKLLELNDLQQPEDYIGNMNEDFGKQLPKFRDIEHTIDVFKSNRNVLFLDKKEIPKHVIDNIVNIFKDCYKQPQNLDKLLDLKNIMTNTNIPNNFFNNLMQHV